MGTTGRTKRSIRSRTSMNIRRRMAMRTRTIRTKAWKGADLGTVKMGRTALIILFVLYFKLCGWRRRRVEGWRVERGGAR